jgi:predicted TIM-barrel fold metal-dependent hydrolase
MNTTTVNRRDFLRRVGMGAGGGLAVPRSVAAREQARASEDLFPKGTFVDIHVHLAQPWVRRAPVSVDSLLRWMDARGIGQAVVLPLISPEGFDYAVSTEFVLSETGSHRDRLVPFCDVDPRTDMSYQEIRDLLLKYKEAGARGLGEHKCGVPVDDPRNMTVFRACAEVGFPALVHIDNMRNTDAPGLPGLAKVLDAFPTMNVIGHAPGFWSNISGNATQAQLHEYPKGPVAPGGALDALLEKYSNLYCDLSAGSGHNAIHRDLDFGRAFVLRRASRLVFGTDYLADGQEVPQFALYKKLDLPPAVQEMVFRGNARRLLGSG